MKSLPDEIRKNPDFTKKLFSELTEKYNAAHPEDIAAYKADHANCSHPVREDGGIDGFARADTILKKYLFDLQNEKSIDLKNLIELEKTLGIQGYAVLEEELSTELYMQLEIYEKLDPRKTLNQINFYLAHPQDPSSLAFFELLSSPTFSQIIIPLYIKTAHQYPGGISSLEENAFLLFSHVPMDYLTDPAWIEETLSYFYEKLEPPEKIRSLGMGELNGLRRVLGDANFNKIDQQLAIHSRSKIYGFLPEDEWEVIISNPESIDNFFWNSPTFIIQLANFFYLQDELSPKIRGRIIQNIPEDLKNNFRLMAILGTIDPLFISETNPQLLENKEFMLWAIDEEKRDLEGIIDQKSRIILIDFPLKNDVEFLKEAIKRNPEIYTQLENSFKNEKRLAIQYTLSSPHLMSILSHVPNTLLIDPAFWKEIISIDGSKSSYKNCPAKEVSTAIKEALKDEKVVMQGARTYGYIIAFTEEEMSLNKELIKACVYKDASAIECVDERLRNDKNFILDLVFTNFHIIEFLSPDEKQNLWPKVIKRCKEMNIYFPNEATESFESFQLFILTNLSNYPERFRKFETVYTLWKNSQLTEYPAGKPIVLMIYPLDDYNGAFADIDIDEIVTSGEITPVYFETFKEEKAWEKIKEMIPRTNSQGNAVVFAGHGNETSLQFGEGFSSSTLIDDEEFLDVTDFDKEHMELLNTFLGKNGSVWLSACSNGLGGILNKENQANQLYKTGKGSFSVYSAQVDTNTTQVGVSVENGVVEFKLEYWDGDPAFNLKAK